MRPDSFSRTCWRVALLIGGVTALVARAAPAQTSTGSIRGYVRDSSGAPLAGARVIAVNVQTAAQREVVAQASGRSEEHTSELQSQSNLVCRLLLEKKKKRNSTTPNAIWQK